MATFLILTIGGLLLICIPFVSMRHLVTRNNYELLLALMTFLIPIGKILFKLGLLYGVTYFAFYCFGLLNRLPVACVWGCVAVECLLTAIFSHDTSKND